MSIEIINRSGTATAGTRSAFKNIAKYGKEARSGAVDVNIPSICNRVTSEDRIAKYLKEGWNWNLFSPVIVANFIGGSRKGQEFLLDGDHRRHMYKLTFSDKEDIPAYIIAVESEEEYHSLFVKLNWSQRKQANAEEVFIHQVLSKEPDAIKLEQQLSFCGVRVYGSPDPFGTVGCKTGKNVKIGAFKRALKNGQDAVSQAATVMANAWHKDEKLYGELHEGISILYGVFPALSAGGAVERDFKLYMKNMVGKQSQVRRAREFKKAGGDVHHRHGASIAMGILDDYLATEVSGGCDKSTKRKQLKDTYKIERLLKK